MALEALGVAVGSDGARMAFFESRLPLVEDDRDDSYDVYQWRKGELTLISPGVNDPDGAFYVGNDRTGRNVYFATRDQLTWQDSDRQLDVYTARVGGGIPQVVVDPPCTGPSHDCRDDGVGRTWPQIEHRNGPSDPPRPKRRRKTLTLGRPTRDQLRRAAHTGRIRLSVRGSGAGVVVVSARARLGTRTRVVGRGSKRVTKPGRVTVTVRLNARARAVLARGDVLRVTLRASQAGARSRSMTVRLKRAGR